MVHVIFSYHVVQTKIQRVLSGHMGNMLYDIFHGSVSLCTTWRSAVSIGWQIGCDGSWLELPSFRGIDILCIFSRDLCCRLVLRVTAVTKEFHPNCTKFAAIPQRSRVLYQVWQSLPQHLQVRL